MTSRIKLLPENLINRIAAGEVVERPASILKELLENSLDAGATRVELEIASGGKKLVRVTDNGCGLNREELFLCLERHATSKLSAEDDLWNISTLGFRGEALPSIASVSRTTIVSKPADGPGHKLRIDCGRVLELSPAAANQGTTVEVRDLFHSIPARRKFLKTDATETAHLVEVAQRYALSRPGLRLRLLDGQREVLMVDERSDLPSRVSKILGRAVASSLREFKSDLGDLKISGWLGDPVLSARSAGSLFLFVLGRPVRDRLLTRAVLQGYGRTVPQGRWPAGVIFLDLDPSQVDVNVHPAKTEVRFRDGGRVFDALSSAVKKAVDLSPVAMTGGAAGSADAGLDAPGRADRLEPRSPPAWRAPDGRTDYSPGGGGSYSRGGGGCRRGPGQNDQAGRSYHSAPSPSSSSSASRWIGPGFSMGRPGAGTPPSRLETPGPPPWMLDDDPTNAAAADGLADGHGDSRAEGHDDGRSEGRTANIFAGGAGDAAEPFTGLPPDIFPGSDGPPEPDADDRPAGRTPAGPVRPLAQLRQSYVLAEGPEGLYIVDQHAAHERILFNALKKNLAERGLPAQNLILTKSFELGPQEALAAEKLSGHLRRLGFHLEPFGGGSWVMRAAPALLTPPAAQEALMEILAAASTRLKSLDGAGLEQTVDDLSSSWLDSLACRAAVKAGDHLEPMEMEKLLADLAEAETGGYCPHGRPAVIVLSLRELQKRFGRT
ncbi:MAG: DNA mismatch repair endonuclease MutL [Deltaproteobacteria bacterium]|jgi:DNA mismatch repair protein MutL|nr:DNA mismatch repair endonuclease MutL [Deltaproteobacteria bacterium]